MCYFASKSILEGADLKDACFERALLPAEHTTLSDLKGQKPDTLQKCNYPPCDKTEKKRREFSYCSACKSVVYCSTECQKKDWKLHKISCKNSTPLSHTSQSSENSTTNSKKKNIKKEKKKKKDK